MTAVPKVRSPHLPVQSYTKSIGRCCSRQKHFQLFLFPNFDEITWCLPSCIKELWEVNKSNLLDAVAPTSKVKDDQYFHGAQRQRRECWAETSFIGLLLASAKGMSWVAAVMCAVLRGEVWRRHYPWRAGSQDIPSQCRHHQDCTAYTVQQCC